MTPGAREVDKARRDPYFEAVLRRYGIHALREAGFFDDGAEIGVDMSNTLDHRLPVTSLEKLLARAQTVRGQYSRNVVLIASGGFCPIHDGHLAMMESAKTELERNSIGVVAGFIAPDHDQYLQLKCGDQALAAAERVELVRVATRDSEWLEVDPWAALYVDRALNFSDITRRMESYLKCHVPFDLEVFFVCGSDNAGFARAFAERGGVVIVPRGGVSCRLGLTKANQRIFIGYPNPYGHLTSTAIRNSFEWRVRVNGDDSEALKSIRRVRIKLRDEGTWALTHLRDIAHSKLTSAAATFTSGVRDALREAFERGYPQADVSVEPVSLAAQRDVVYAKLRLRGVPAISLDPCVPTEFNVALSRTFSLTESIRKPGLVERPGHPSLEEQLRAIPPGDYIILDDDIATGRTMRDFISLLPSHVRVVDTCSVYALDSTESLCTFEMNPDEELSDIGDTRDFLLGTREGGLVTTLFNRETARVPYLLPYTRNMSRMSIPLGEEQAFSKAVWRLNVEFFEALGAPVRVSECAKVFGVFARSIGFSESDTLLDIAAWHLSRLFRE